MKEKYIQDTCSDSICIEIIKEYFYVFEVLPCIKNNRYMDCQKILCIQLLLRLKDRISPCTSTSNGYIQSNRNKITGQYTYCIFYKLKDNRQLSGLFSQFKPPSGNSSIGINAYAFYNLFGTNYRW